ncbi:MAG: hypothetical protein MUC85_03195 [Anaerolineales bacterium]|jgi:hypothetical protein|nr:hypothetical protein [Anaerolineales bacterium]
METAPQLLHKYKPAVLKNWLLLAAGLVWFGVGVMLINFASQWLKPVHISSLLLLVFAGILLAAAIYFFGFSRLAKKNIERIRSLGGEKNCLFAFQAWTSYPLVAVMVSMGIYLRVYSPIPKPLLAVMYLGIGGGLSSASLHYFRRIAQLHLTRIRRGC